jgi:hypothetical protein
MTLCLMFRAASPEAWAAFEAEQGWTDAAGVEIDHVGAIEGVDGHHVNVRLSGAAADAETEGLEQVDAEGNPRPTRERTHVGRRFLSQGAYNGTGKAKTRTLGDIALIYEDSVQTPARLWL